MKTFNRIATLSLIGLLFCCAVQAQQNLDFVAYKEAAGKNSVLFRGKRAFSYNILYNGHCYWSTPDFKPGEIIYNGKHYYDVLLNVDACRKEVLAKAEQPLMPVVLVSDNIEWFTMGGERFERLSGKFRGKMPSDFCQILWSDGSQTVYKRVYKVLTNNTLYNNGDSIGYEDPNYNSLVLNFFQYNARYYWLKEGVLKKISKGKARKLSGRL